jgi:hypothetical protein
MPQLGEGKPIDILKSGTFVDRRDRRDKTYGPDVHALKSASDTLGNFLTKAASAHIS